MRLHPLKDDDNAGGFALVSVLLIVALLSAATIVMLQAARSAMHNVEAEIQAYKTRYAGDAGLAVGLSALKGGKSDLLNRLRTSPHVDFRYDEFDLKLSLTTESGKIDLNTGDPALVVNLVKNVITNRDVADRVLAELRRMPANKSYHSPKEIFSRGDRLGPEAFRLSESLTTLSGSRGFDFYSASVDALRALPNISASEIQRFLELRKRGPSNSTLEQFGRHIGYLSAQRPIYRIRSVVSGAGSGLKTREAVVLIDQQQSVTRSFVLSWKEIVAPLSVPTE